MAIYWISQTAQRTAQISRDAAAAIAAAGWVVSGALAWWFGDDDPPMGGIPVWWEDCTGEDVPLPMAE